MTKVARNLIIAFGCVLLAGIAAALLVRSWWPGFVEAAQRREYGRGMQSVVEFYFRSPDLFEPLAVAKSDITDGEIGLEAVVVFRYAGPYAIDLRLSSIPDHRPSFDQHPRIEIKMSADSGDSVIDSSVGFRSEFWGGGTAGGFSLFTFDVPTDLPLDRPINVSIAVHDIPEGFEQYYGKQALLTLARRSSE